MHHLEMAGIGEEGFLILSMCVYLFLERELWEFCPICVRHSKSQQSCWALSHCEVLIIPNSTECCLLCKSTILWLHDTWNRYKIFIVCFSSFLVFQETRHRNDPGKIPFCHFFFLYGFSMAQKACPLMWGRCHSTLVCSSSKHYKRAFH